MSGFDTNIASLVDVDLGPSSHSVPNDKICTNNRIPPRGYTPEPFSSFGGRPVGAFCADGQYRDAAAYNIPAAATSVEVALYYQNMSWESVEFLRDQNNTNNNGECPPERFDANERDEDFEEDLAGLGGFKIVFGRSMPPAPEEFCSGSADSRLSGRSEFAPQASPW
ncbi:MAG: hypothetical protein JXB13_14150 [Phycisphaerae bacterium]|nr:hypothetical protein [Phycisphaerae bacterium]